MAKITPHPDYIDIEREDHELYHDIALLQLERPILEFIQGKRGTLHDRLI